MQFILNQYNHPKIIERSVSALERGGMIVYPSDTVYGIAVDATNPEALKALDLLKQRRPDQKYSYNFANIEMIEKYIKLSKSQKKILEEYLPGSYTFILTPELSVRIPQDSIITEITQAFGKPTTATSANITGYKPATNIKNLDAKIYLKVDHIIENPDFEPKNPSTIVDISTEKPKVIRVGDLPFPKKT